MSHPVEFWSSVEYGTFLKALVRELCGASAAKEEGGVKSAEVGSGCATKAEGEKVQGGNGALPDGIRAAAESARITGASASEKAEGGASASDTPPRNLGCGTDTRSDPTTGFDLLAARSSLLAPAAQARQRFAVAESAYRQARGALARLAMRWRCYVGYPLQLRRRIRREAAPAALVVCTNTFYAPWVAMRSARKRGIPVVHWMFDLFPDVLILAGKVRAGSWAECLLRRWVRAMFDGAAANVFLGERLLAYAETKFGPIPRSVVIPVGCDAAPFAGKEPVERRPARKCGNQEGGNGERTMDRLPRTDVGGLTAEELAAKNAESTKIGGRSLLAGDHGNEIGRGASASDDPTVFVLYCGNFGRMHEVDTLVAVLRDGAVPGVRMAFRGNGAGFQTLATALRDLGLVHEVQLGENLPDVEWLDAMTAADVALVTMKRGAEGIVMPSKTYSAMAAGQAILAVCPKESDLADTVTKHDCGWVIEPGDVTGLRALLESLPQRGDEVLAKRRNAWRAARECYDQKVLAVRWCEVLSGLKAPDCE